MQLPKDRISLNDLIRYYDALNPIVNSVLSFHSTYPISKFNITAHKTCLEYLVKLRLIEPRFEGNFVKPGGNLLALSKEFWRIGEVFPYILNNKFTILNPDNIFLKISDGSILVTPDAILKKLVNSSNSADLKLKDKLPRSLIESVENNDYIPLDKSGVSAILNLRNPYDLRGTSIVSTVLMDLKLFDYLHENLLPVDDCIPRIYKGLLFSKENLPALLSAYTIFRRKIEDWLINVLSLINPSAEFLSISWSEIDVDELKDYLRGTNES